MSDVLATHEDLVVASADYWTSDEVGSVWTSAVRRQYRDHTIVAEAAGLQWPKSSSEAALVAQIAAVMCVFKWNDGKM